MLLPTHARNRQLPDTPLPTSQPDQCALGLFLVDPFLRFDTVAERLNRQNIGWISNFPSVGQHDPAFESFLSDVNLGLATELDRLQHFKDSGFSTLAMVCHVKDTEAVLRCAPDVIAYLPSVATFIAGMPNLAERQAHQDAIESKLRQAGWRGVFLGYATAQEQDSITNPALIRPSRW